MDVITIFNLLLLHSHANFNCHFVHSFVNVIFAPHSSSPLFAQRLAGSSVSYAFLQAVHGLNLAQGEAIRARASATKRRCFTKKLNRKQIHIFAATLHWMSQDANITRYLFKWKMQNRGQYLNLNFYFATWCFERHPIVM